MQPQPPHQQPTYVVRTAKKSRKGLIIGLIAGGLAAVCGVCVVAGVIATAGSDNGKGSSGGQAAAPADKPVGLNQPARDGKFEFVVTSVDCGRKQVGEGYLVRKAQGQYCIVQMVVRNIGDEPRSMNDSSQEAYGADGAKFSADSAATLYAAGDQNLWLTEINPGNQITGPLVYDIPAAAKLVKLVLHDSAFSGGVTVTLP